MLSARKKKAQKTYPEKFNWSKSHLHDRKFLLAVKNVTLIEEKKIPDSFSEQFDDTTRKRRIYIKIVMNYIPTLCTTTTDAKENKDDFDFFFQFWICNVVIQFAFFIQKKN